MARYDIEDFADSVKALLISKLNTKIAQIDSLKSDSLVIPQINANAYAFQDMNEKVMNFNPYIVYGFDDIQTIPQLKGSAVDVSLSVIIVLCENGVLDIDRIMIRYSRALKEVIEENNQSVGKGIKMVVNQFMPISFKLLGSDEIYKAIGININATIA